MIISLKMALLAALLLGPGLAAGAKPESRAAVPVAAVTFEGVELFRVGASFSGFSAQERADAVSQRLKALKGAGRHAAFNADFFVGLFLENFFRLILINWLPGNKPSSTYN